MDTESVNEISSKPKHCWRRIDLESPESFVRKSGKVLAKHVSIEAR